MKRSILLTFRWCPDELADHFTKKAIRPIELIVGRNHFSLNYIKAKEDGYDLKGAMFCSGLFKRPKWDEPSPTVLTNFHNPRYFLHPSEYRPFTLRECARLQGFDDTFLFHGDGSIYSLEDGYRLVVR